MAGKIYEEQHLVTHYEGDQTGTMKIPMVINAMLLTSDNQSQALGVGNEVVDQTGLGWVITQYLMHVTRLPRVGEKIMVGTKAVSNNDYFCQRDFWIKDQDGEVIVKNTSIFVLMDRTTRRMHKLVPEIIEPYEAEKVKRIVRLPKLITVEGQATAKDYTVEYFDIDPNCHVNNAKYFEWIFNSVDAEILNAYYPTQINIRYHVEIQPNQTAHSQVTFDMENLKSDHKISANDTLCCEANVEWQHR